MPTHWIFNTLNWSSVYFPKCWTIPYIFLLGDATLTDEVQFNFSFYKTSKPKLWHMVMLASHVQHQFQNIIVWTDHETVAKLNICYGYITLVLLTSLLLPWRKDAGDSDCAEMYVHWLFFPPRRCWYFFTTFMHPKIFLEAVWLAVLFCLLDVLS